MRRRLIIITITLLLQLVARLHGYEELSVDDDDEPRDSSFLHQILSVFLTDSDIDVSDLNGLWPFNDTEIICEKTNTRDTDYLKYGGYSAYDERSTLSVKSCGRNIFTPQETHNDNHQLPVQNGNSFDESSTSELRSRLEELLQEIRNNRRMRDEQFWSRRRRSVKVESKDSRVVGGHASQDGAWPWLAAIGHKNRGPKCGGTLIADQWVITASHCFNDREASCQYNVRLGSRNWLYDNENTHVDSTVQAIFRHPKFDVKTMANDVALIKLSSPVKLDPAGFINAACLPTTERSVPTEAVCLAAGWGRLSESSRSHVLESREVEVSVLTYKDPCGDYKVGTMRPGMMCVGDRQGGHDTCQGDSGGPLIRRVDNRWTLIGITSFGEGCARAGYPGVYTDVGHHINWINSVIRRHS